MKRQLVFVLALVWIGVGCSKGGKTASSDPNAIWFSSPNKVVEGLTHAYQTRDDSLYAALLAADFRYFLEPVGADSSDILDWGKEEEVVATRTLLKAQDVAAVSYTLDAGSARPATGEHRKGWMAVPISGGRLVVEVKNKEPMVVQLNRQEILTRPVREAGKPTRWEIVEWHDYPRPEPE